jgi:hypothetical protein
MRNELQRLSELREHSIGLGLATAYFQPDDDKFSNLGKRQAFLDVEAELQGLDDEAWELLKAEALPRLSAKHPTRFWQPLFDTLNEAKGYNYLAGIGCAGVRFIRRSTRKTPDLRGLLAGEEVLCDVKTINISDVEVDRRLTGGVGSTLPELKEGFFKKLMSDIATAANQMLEYDDGAKHRFVYCIFKFDDSLHECADKYRAQIEAYLTTAAKPNVRIVLEIRSPFFPDVLSVV